MSWLDGLANALLTARDEALRKQREQRELEQMLFQNTLLKNQDTREQGRFDIGKDTYNTYTRPKQEEEINRLKYERPFWEKNIASNSALLKNQADQSAEELSRYKAETPLYLQRLNLDITDKDIANKTAETKLNWLPKQLQQKYDIGAQNLLSLALANEFNESANPLRIASMSLANEGQSLANEGQRLDNAFNEQANPLRLSGLELANIAQTLSNERTIAETPLYLKGLGLDIEGKEISNKSAQERLNWLPKQLRQEYDIGNQNLLALTLANEFDKAANPLKLSNMSLVNEGQRIENLFNEQANPLRLSGLELANIAQTLSNERTIAETPLRISELELANTAQALANKKSQNELEWQPKFLQQEYDIGGQNLASLVFGNKKAEQMLPYELGVAEANAKKSQNEAAMSDIELKNLPEQIRLTLMQMGIDIDNLKKQGEQLDIENRYLPPQLQANIEHTKANTAAINASAKSAASSSGSRSSGSSSSNTTLKDKEVYDIYSKYYNSAVNSFDTDYNNWYQRNTKTVNGVRITTGTYPGYKYNGKTYVSREALGNAVAMDQLKLLGIIPEEKSAGKTTNSGTKSGASGSAKTTKSGAYVPSTPPPKGVDLTLWNAVDKMIVSKKSFTEALRQYSKENPTGWNNPNDPIFKIFKKRAEIKKLNFAAIVESIKPGGKKK
jgi:hypothetical protein